MGRKIQYLSEITAAFDADQQEAWKESCDNSGAVLDGLITVLQKKIVAERKELTLDRLLESHHPDKVLLARQAKIEALEEIINLVIDK